MSNESKRYVFSDNAEWSKVVRCMPCVLHTIDIDIKDTKGETYKTNLSGNERDVLMLFILSYDMNALQYKQMNVMCCYRVKTLQNISTLAVQQPIVFVTV